MSNPRASRQPTDFDGCSYYFVDEPPDGLKCPICHSIAKEAQQHSCGKLFCEECVDELGHANTCPNCRGEFNTFPDKRGDQEVKALKIRCNNLENGCQWIGELGNAVEHHDKCQYAIAACSNSCGSIKLQRRDQAKHLEDECPNRLYKCPECNQSGPYGEQTTSHLEVCEMVVVKCSNKECQETVVRKNVKRHREECEFEITSCKFAKLGCAAQQTRKEICQHKEDSSLHLQSTKKETVLELMKTLQELTKKLKEQDKKIESLSKEVHEKNTSHTRSFTTPSHRLGGGTSVLGSSFSPSNYASTSRKRH